MTAHPRVRIKQCVSHRGNVQRVVLLSLSWLLIAVPQKPQPRHSRVIAYDCEPRRADGRVDQARVLAMLKAGNLDGYDYLLWHAPTDWDDLGPFLTMMDSTKLTSWITVTPPTEQRPPARPTLPFDTNYVAWLVGIAELEHRHSSLEALVIDDFDLNASFFTAPLLRKMRAAKNAFPGSPKTLGVIYRRTVDSLSTWLSARDSLLDGVVFAYENFTSTDSLAPLLRTIRRQLPKTALLALNLYVTGGYRAPAPHRTEAYLKSAMTIADTMVDVLRLYCIPKDTPDALFVAVARFNSAHGHGAIPASRRARSPDP